MLEVEAIGGLAWIAHNGGELDRAVELYEEELEGARELGFSWFIALASANLAECHLELGHLEAAEGHGLDALAVASEIDDQRHTAWILLVLAMAAVRRGDPERGGRLAGAAEAKRARDGLGWSEADYNLWTAELPTGDPAFEAGRAAGLRLSLEEAAAEELAQRDAT